MPPSPARSADLDSVMIHDRQPVSERVQDVTLHLSGPGGPGRSTLTVSRPTRFEDVIVGVTEGSSSPRPSSAAWRWTPKGAARFAYHKARALRSQWQPPLRHDLPMFDVRAVEPNNIAHLLLLILPLSLHLQKVLDGQVTTVFRDVRHPWREVLDVLGINATFTARRLEGPMARIRGTRGLAAYDLLDVFDVPAVSVVPDPYRNPALVRSGNPGRIFIARRDARSLLNQPEVERILTGRGYETIFMEDHPIIDQFSLAASARHVVAVHGAGMAGLVMNPGLDSVIELLPPNVYHDFYPLCLAGRVKEYSLLMPGFDERIQHGDWSTILAHKNAPFAVDLVALEGALDTL